MTNEKLPNEVLIKSLLELAAELDKGENADIGWLKYQGDSVRDAARLIHCTFTDDPMPEEWLKA